jgi:hypothetical protein
LANWAVISVAAGNSMDKFPPLKGPHCRIVTGPMAFEFLPMPNFPDVEPHQFAMEDGRHFIVDPARKRVVCDDGSFLQQVWQHNRYGYHVSYLLQDLGCRVALTGPDGESLDWPPPQDPEGNWLLCVGEIGFPLCINTFYYDNQLRMHRPPDYMHQIVSNATSFETQEQHDRAFAFLKSLCENLGNLILALGNGRPSGRGKLVFAPNVRFAGAFGIVDDK